MQKLTFSICIFCLAAILVPRASADAVVNPPAKAVPFVQGLQPTSYVGQTVAIQNTTIAVVGNGRDNIGNIYGYLNVFDTSQAQPQVVQTFAGSTGATSEVQYGRSVAMDGNRIVVGSPEIVGPASLGVVHVYTRSGASWSGVTLAENASFSQGIQGFGLSVGVSGDTILVGSNGGGAWVYQYNTSQMQWVLQSVARPNGGTTQNLYNTIAQSQGQNFGQLVAISGDRIIVAAPVEAGNNSSTEFFAFDRSNGVWAPENNGAPVAGITGAAASLSLSGNAFATGACPRPAATGCLSAGSAQVFRYSSPGDWAIDPGPTSPNSATNDGFGLAVSISGDTLIVGAPNDGGTGAAYWYAWLNGIWTVQDTLKGSGQGGVYFGGAVGISGVAMVVGDPDYFAGMNYYAGEAYLYYSSGYGDADGNGSFGMGDINATVDYILGKPTAFALDSLDFFNADVNRDGVVNMADLNIMVDCLVGRTVSEPNFCQLPVKQFSPPAPQWGDTNLDGLFNMADVDSLAALILGEPPNVSNVPWALANSDVNGDGLVNMADLNLYVDCLLGRISEFPVGPPAGLAACPNSTPAEGTEHKPQFPTLSTPSSLVSGPSAGMLRNNFSGFAGMKFTVGIPSISVYQVGRICVAGNSQSHLVKIVNAATGADVPGASASVNMTGCTAGQFQYANLPGLVTLQAGTAYYLVSQENNGGDQWYDSGAITVASGITVNSSIWFDGITWHPVGLPNTSYVPPTFQYLLNNNPGFVTAFDLNSPSVRNDYTGLAGMEITVGSNPLSVNSLGRACLPGNAQIHTVEIVQADIGAVVASAAVNMAGCTTGQFAYTDLNAPVTLQAGVMYYLVSQETAGGDTWFDHGAIATTNVAAAGNSIWSVDGSVFHPVDGANTSYVPPDFIYTVLSPSSPISYVSNFNLDSPPLRNNFTGYAGMQLVVGPSSITVAQMGRLCAPGNSGTHQLEFVNAATNAIVPNSVVSVNMANCATGQFVYTPTAGSVILQGSTSYYLVSQETNGGDLFYDHGAITTTGVASVSNSIWTVNGSQWNALDGSNTSYGPVNFTYQ